MYKFGLIGNCQISALIDEMGSIDWLCLPRPDSPPIFGRMLDEKGGNFAIEGLGRYTSHQAYLPNTCVLVTTMVADDGSSFKITDFCPRFYQHGRTYRPISLFRIVEPLRGHPQICVRCDPVNGWEKERVKPVRGNSHLRYDIKNEQLRLITNMSLTYLTEETYFPLQEKLYFGLSWSFGIEEDLGSMTERFLDETIKYWEVWVKHCSIPSLFQQETIRSALTLKLHCYEDTGAILASVSTSLPEEIGGTRNWDYRYCWLRDAYYVLTAFYNLGHFEEMEGFLKFILSIAETHEHSREKLWPVYRLDQSLPLPENEHNNWKGYLDSRPVRSNNQAAEHVQNDVYGEMILTLSPIYFDERFRHLRHQAHEKLLLHLAKFCTKNIGQPDAGLWEFRNGWREHSFSNLMCWAGLDRLQKIQSVESLKLSNKDFEAAKMKAEQRLQAAVSEGRLQNGPTDFSCDASLLQTSILRFPDEELCRQTIAWTQANLKISPEHSAFLFRYSRNDDFGKPKSAFLVCSFWLIQALARIGKMTEARAAMQQTMTAANSLGLFSEHYFPLEKRQAGNFPQAYSHVGQINAAFAISPAWSEVL